MLKDCRHLETLQLGNGGSIPLSWVSTASVYLSPIWSITRATGNRNTSLVVRPLGAYFVCLVSRVQRNSQQIGLGDLRHYSVFVAFYGGTGRKKKRGRS